MTFRSTSFHLLCTLLTLGFSPSLAHGQDAPSIVVLDRPELAKEKCEGLGESQILHDGTAYILTACEKSKDGGPFRLVASDAVSGKVLYVKKVAPPVDEKEDYAFESMAYVGDKLWVFYIMFDRAKGEGVYSINAWPLDPTSGSADGGARRIGEVQFSASGTGINKPTRIGLKFTSSPDSHRLLMVYDRLRDKDQYMLLCTWLLGDELEPEWTAVFQISSSTFTYGLLPNEGPVYGYFNQGVWFPIEGTKYSRSASVLKLTEQGYAPVFCPDPGEGFEYYGATLMADGQLMLAGLSFKIDKKILSGPALGVIFQRFGPDLQPIGEPGQMSFEHPPAGERANIVIHPRPDGGAYLVAEEINSYNNQVSMSAAACGPDGKVEWTWTVPRGIIVLNNDIWCHSGLDGNDLVILVAETEKNIEAWKVGEKIKSSGKFKDRVTDLIRFNGTGTATHSILRNDILLLSNWSSTENHAMQICGCYADKENDDVQRRCIIKFQ